MMNVYALKQSEKLNQQIFDKMMSLVSEEKKNRINRFFRWEDAQRTLTAELLVRLVACSSLNLRNTDLVFTKNKYKKPFLSVPGTLFFNISHSGTWVVAAFSKYVEVGIDVEKIKKTDFSIAKRFFSKDEYHYIMETPDEYRHEVFYDLWTLKESYIKAVGKGLYQGLDTFSILFTNGNIRLKGVPQDSHFSFKQYSIDKNYKLSVCAAGNIQSDALHILDLNDFTRQICKSCLNHGGPPHTLV